MHLFEELNAAFSSYQPQSVILSILKDKLKSPSLLYLMNCRLGTTTFGYTGGGSLLHVMINHGYMDCVAYLLKMNKTTFFGSGREYVIDRSGRYAIDKHGELIRAFDKIRMCIFLQDDLGRNAFELAASKGYFDLCVKLVDFELEQEKFFHTSQIAYSMADYHAQASQYSRHPLLAVILDPLIRNSREFSFRIQMNNVQGVFNNNLLNRLRLLSFLVDQFNFYPIRGTLSDVQVLAQIVQMYHIHQQSDMSLVGGEEFDEILTNLFGDSRSVESLCQMPHDIDKPATLLFHHGVIEQKIKRDRLIKPDVMFYSRGLEVSAKLESVAPKLRYGFR